MTPDAVRRWLADMKSAGLAKSDAECARLLGMEPRWLPKWKREGVSGPAAERTALACRALLHRLEPYG